MKFAIILCTAIGLIGADPKPDEPTWINNNTISMVFNEKVVLHEVVVTDSKGCKVSQSEEIGSENQVVVHLKACEVMGYPGGHMDVKYTVNGWDGGYHLHIRHHH